ncbi:MAG TPA: hypothetical protein VHA06_06255 [Candidatus Angelobacter sp.]|jgi:hypothetical protein|nr:hypothetical protein [Candidatus Angelobacter sp.]
MKVNVILVGAQPDEQTPQAAIYSVTPAGQIGKKLATIEKGSVEIPADVVKHKQVIIAVGPDTADAMRLDAGALFQFRLADQLPTLQKNPVLEVPSQRWRLWLRLRICVAGSIRKCSPIIFEPAAIRRGALARIPFPPFEVCFPMCNGVVEVWEQTCCCFPFVTFELPSIIKRIKNLVDREPLKFPPPPPGDPGLIDHATLQNIDRALALGHVDSSVVPNTELYADLLTLQSLPADQALQYLQLHPPFWPFLCRCTSAKKGETVLNPDGSFNFCFNEFPILLFNCRKSYFYKVKQFQNGQWVYVYDGVASHQYFNADQFASLFTFRGQSCGQQPPPPGEDFATLQTIGITPSYELNSHYAGQNAAGVDLTQTGATNLLAPPSDAGLLLVMVLHGV